jgi:hypothetical protein
MKLITQSEVDNLILTITDEFVEVRTPEQIPFNDNINPDSDAENILYFHIDEIEDTKRIFEIFNLINLFYTDRIEFLHKLNYNIL